MVWLAIGGVVALAYVTLRLGSGVNNALTELRSEFRHDIEELQGKIREVEDTDVDTALDELRWRVEILEGTAEPPSPSVVAAYNELGLTPPRPR
jgi:hypothetical protein